MDVRYENKYSRSEEDGAPRFRAVSHRSHERGSGPFKDRSTGSISKKFAILTCLMMALAGFAIPLVHKETRATTVKPSMDIDVPNIPHPGGTGPSGNDTTDWKRYPYEVGPFTFPKDEGAHPETAEEWWYLNGHLRADDGRWYDFSASFMKHDILVTALYDEDRDIYVSGSTVFLQTEKAVGHMDLRYGENLLSQVTDRPFTYILVLDTDTLHLSLNMTAVKRPIVANGDGVMRMGWGATFYYSLTEITAVGILEHDSSDTRVSGTVWMDRQWGLWSPNIDWDWYSIRLQNGAQLMVYKTYEGIDHTKIGLFVSIVEPDGQVTYLSRTRDEFVILVDYARYWRSPETHRLYSNGWNVSIPEMNITLAITPMTPAQEIEFPYHIGAVMDSKSFWEGSCEVSGLYHGQAVTGQATVETTFDHVHLQGDLIVNATVVGMGGDLLNGLLITVSNKDRLPIRDTEVVVTSGNPYDGGEILERLIMTSPTNSSVYSDVLAHDPNLPLYLWVDPDNTVPETNEGNNLAVVTT